MNASVSMGEYGFDSLDPNRCNTNSVPPTLTGNMCKLTLYVVLQKFVTIAGQNLQKYGAGNSLSQGTYDQKLIQTHISLLKQRFGNNFYLITQVLLTNVKWMINYTNKHQHHDRTVPKGKAFPRSILRSSSFY